MTYQSTRPEAMGHPIKDSVLVGIEGIYRSLGLALDLKIQPIPGVSFDPRSSNPTHEVYGRFSGSNDEFCPLGSGWQREITAQSARNIGGMLVSMALEDPAFIRVTGNSTLRITAFPESPMSQEGCEYTIRADRPRQNAEK